MTTESPLKRKLMKEKGKENKTKPESKLFLNEQRRLKKGCATDCEGSGYEYCADSAQEICGDGE